MNPINYARGLVDEFEGTQRSGDKARESIVREQLAWIAGELDKVDPASLGEEIRAMHESAKTAVAEALATKAKRATSKSE